MKRLSLKVWYRSEYIDVNCYYYDFPFIGVHNDWMLREYPKLEYFGPGRLLSGIHTTDKLNTFFKLNPSIRKCAVDVSYYFVNDIANIGLEVDVLAIICDDFELGMSQDLYKELSEQKFFKRLQLYGASLLPENCADLSPLEGIGALEKLQISGRFFSFCSLQCMTNLKTLCFEDVMNSQFEDIDEICTLTQLERVSIDKATQAQMGAFIGHLPKLNTFTVQKIKNGNVNINLLRWNREENYLAVKRATHETNYKLVEIKRFESYEWDHDFGYPQRRY